MAGPQLGDVLDLVQLDDDRFRSELVYEDPTPTYGGQVVGQALLAAGLTVGDDRLPHSLHGYFLRGGDPAGTVEYRVERDRDGRSFSARRVEALQGDRVIFTLAASFHVTADGPDRERAVGPATTPPDAGQPLRIPRLYGIELRTATEDWPDAPWPTRFWARASEELATPLLHTCALAYLSDISSGLFAFNSPTGQAAPSLDHVVWFHRPVDLSGWLLVDFVPQITAAGRGWYDGGCYDESGRRVASVSQEGLFRFVHRADAAASMPRLDRTSPEGRP